MNIRSGRILSAYSSWSRAIAGVASIAFLSLIPGCQATLPTSDVPLPRGYQPLSTRFAPSSTFTDSRRQAAKKQVTIVGMTGTKQEESIKKALEPFEQQTGIEIIYSGIESFNTRLPEQVKSGNTSNIGPDIAIVPQPGLIAELANANEIVPLSSFLDSTQLRSAYSDTWLDLGSVEGELYALFYRVSVKSLVWYSPIAFETKGYDIPRTWADLMALSDRIVADGGNPWCIGLESGDISGWPGTDWIEDIMLRTAGPEAYRQWITHELPFNSPQVLKAFQLFEQILHSPSYVSGGAITATQLNYADAPLGLFQSPPACYMHRQANFILTTYPEEKAPRVDYDFFLLPGIDQRFGTPLLVAGDALVMLQDTDEARQLMTYLTTSQPYEVWAKAGNFIAPHRGVDIETYPDIVIQRIAQHLQEAEVVRFDGSDLMPRAVGRGSFWSAMMDLAAGDASAELVQQIDEAWPPTASSQTQVWE